MNVWIAAGGVALGLLIQDRGLLTRVVPPPLPLQATSGGEVLMEASVGPSGEVLGITVLRDAPPFTQALVRAVTEWRFRPDAIGTIPGGRVLVAGLFRAPTLLDVVPLPSPPTDVPSARVPLPIRWERPPYPPNALGNGIVILEVSVGADGSVRRITTVHSTPPFARAAEDAARRWKFRPAVVGGQPVSTVAYLVFGLREPVTPPMPVPRTVRDVLLVPATAGQP
jgi:protein TonB